MEKENSFYLQQHKDNLVHWHSWADYLAVKDSKITLPLFLSIGYSTCHWCHVMSHESFDDRESAEFINNNFYPIKIDKEEYPDLDKKYQFFIQTTRQQGGWPLTIFAEPSSEPFFAGTYFPKEDKYGIASFKKILANIRDIYVNDHHRIDKSIEQYDEFKENFYSSSHTLNDLLSKDKNEILCQFKKNFDFGNGGLSGNNKFPNIPVLMFLLDHYHHDKETADFLNLTARKIALSGLNDHLRGGFFRYCVDKEWKIPHFEKMLYDNAQNALFLIKMYQFSGDKLFLHTARKALDYIVYEFSNDYGFASGIDADSLDNNNILEEGYYYLLEENDFDHLQKEELEFLISNIEINDKHLSIKHNTSYSNYLKAELFFEKCGTDFRNRKKLPALDGKVIISWNMLFINAMLEYFESTNEDYYYTLSEAAFSKIFNSMIDGGEIFRINYGDTLFNHCTLEDYAYTIETTCRFHAVTGGKDYLKTAMKLMENAIAIFYRDNRLYYDKEHTLIDTFDDALFSSYGIMIKNISYLKKYGAEYHIEYPVLDYAADRCIKYTSASATCLNEIYKIETF